MTSNHKTPFAGLAILLLSGGVLGLPTVDLGTSVHLGALNAAVGFYSFDNIPYAEPPIGARRFQAPTLRITINRTVNDGSVSRICPAANPAWFGISVPYMLEQLFGPLPGGPPGGPPPAPDPRESEDCLYLDVKAPRAVFDQGRKNLPVLVWIHGGGFAGGSKDNNPAGLIAQGLRNGKQGFVYVAINYRLGLFGFPPKGPGDWDVATNAGLYDQRLALLWVQLNIHRFGGDASKVTVIGESAGASSIAFQLTAFFGIDGTSLFNRAIIQSPAVRPATDAAVYAQVYQQVLSTAGVTSINALRSQSTTQLQDLNRAIVAASSFDHFTFGPNVDGLFIPAPLPVSLKNRHVDQSVDVIVSYTADEGLLFTDPRVQDNTAFKALFTGLMPSIPASKINTLATTIYPEDFSGAQPYTTQSQRLRLALAEGIVLCNVFAVHLGYRNTSRAFIFSVFPNIHASDVPYTFYNGEPVDSFGIPIIPGVATTLQRYVADYAISGTGGGSTAAAIPVYTALARALNVTAAGNAVVTPDLAANRRCRFWVEGLYS